MGEAGVGKSRISYEFRKRVENEDVTFLEGKCLSYSQGVTYHPIIDFYKSNFDIRDNDSDEQIKEKVRASLKQLNIDEASTLPYLLELLSVKDSGFDQIPLSPEGKKDRMIETMIRIPLKGSEIRPLIMVIEDLHWMDKSSEDVLKYMLESISGAKILLIFTYRPEFVHIWGGRSYHNQVNLNRLSNRESLAMVNCILGTEELESELENLILEKTEGVPFFIEEFIKSCNDLNIIERKDNRYYLLKDIKHLSIPSTIHDVIMARVDSLSESAKEVLQTGSVIEREFSYDLILKITNLPEKNLLSSLSNLKDSELIYERGIYPDTIYIFKHSLTREVVYDSIMTNRKKGLHESIGLAMLALFQNNLESNFEILAEHFTRGENFEVGIKYWKLAARKARRSDLSLEAIAHIQRALSCLEKLPDSKSVQLDYMKSKIDLAEYYLNLNYHMEAKETIDSVIESVYELNYRQYYPFINNVLGSYYGYVEEDFPKTFERLEKAIVLSEEVKNYNTLAAAHYFMGNFLGDQCEVEKALIHYNNAFQLAELGNVRQFMSGVKATTTLFLNYIGKIDLALAIR